MKKEHDEEWIELIRAEYHPPELTPQAASRMRRSVEERRGQKGRAPMRKVVWAFAGVFVATLLFAGVLQIEAYQERERLAAHADIVWAIGMLGEPTLDADETEYLPEAFQAIAQLNTTLDFQD